MATSVGLNSNSFISVKNPTINLMNTTPTPTTTPTTTNPSKFNTPKNPSSGIPTTHNLNINNQRSGKDSIIIPTSSNHETNGSLMMNFNNEANIKQILDAIMNNRNSNNTSNSSNTAGMNMTINQTNELSLEDLQNSDQLLQKMQQLLTLENTIKKVENDNYTIKDVMNSDTFYSQIQSLVDLKKMQLEQLLKKAQSNYNPPPVSLSQNNTIPTTSNTAATTASTTNTTNSTNNFNKLVELAKPVKEFLNQNKGQSQEQLVKQILQLISNATNPSSSSTSTGVVTTTNPTSDHLNQNITTSSLNAGSLLSTINNLTNTSAASITSSTFNTGYGSFNDSIIMSDYISPISNYSGSGTSSMNLTNSPIASKKKVLNPQRKDSMKIDTDDPSMNNYLNLSLNNSYGVPTTSSDLTMSTIGISKTKIPSLINPPFHLPGITTLESSTNSSSISNDSNHNASTTDYNYLLSLSGNDHDHNHSDITHSVATGSNTSGVISTATASFTNPIDSDNNDNNNDNNNNENSNNSLLSNPLVREHMDFFSKNDLFNSINYSFTDDY